ncbi:MAG TPA: SRPBCC family protein [Humibacter sp.]|jgi:uncharacterized protein YndB with AHSA1/START domain|nr:SRPBCC family protein [Humibacter sp.]
MTNPTTITAAEGLPYIDIVREFDAPVEAVYRAHTEPDLVKQWLGPRGYEMDIDAYDVRTGGHYRFIHRAPSGEEYAFHGSFHSATTNAQIIQTFEFEGVPGVASIEKLDLEDLGDGRTRTHVHAVYPSLEARDGMLASGMEGGVVEGYEQLDELLAG